MEYSEELSSIVKYNGSLLRNVKYCQFFSFLESRLLIFDGYHFYRIFNGYLLRTIKYYQIIVFLEIFLYLMVLCKELSSI